MTSDPRLMSTLRTTEESVRQDGNLLPRVALLFASIALAFGAIEAWSTRLEMYSDGISYLDIADAIQRADWTSALNAYWSPLYASVLAAVMHFLNPNDYWKFPAV